MSAIGFCMAIISFKPNSHISLGMVRLMAFECYYLIIPGTCHTPKQHQHLSVGEIFFLNRLLNLYNEMLSVLVMTVFIQYSDKPSFYNQIILNSVGIYSSYIYIRGNSTKSLLYTCTSSSFPFSSIYLKLVTPFQELLSPNHCIEAPRMVLLPQLYCLILDWFIWGWYLIEGNVLFSGEEGGGRLRTQSDVSQPPAVGSSHGHQQ